MAEIKAIPTRYKGYTFRSRLEARWAVVFETLGVSWSYEKEGYELSNGEWYLPDFWISDWKAFLEVKPRRRFFIDAMVKAQQLADGSDRDVILLAGDPWFGEYQAMTFSPQTYVIPGCKFYQCPDCGAIWLASDQGIKLTKGSPSAGHRCSNA
jgi:hypothetical protein